MPAGYPQKATKQVISMLEELKANAKNMGFDESKIVISSYSLGRGGYPRFSSGTVYRHGPVKDAVEKEAQKPAEEKKEEESKQESNKSTESNDLKAEQ